MYKVIRRFKERFDDGRVCKPGDIYPRHGFAPPDGRTDALCVGTVSAMNRSGLVYLEAARGHGPEQKTEGTAETPARSNAKPAQTKTKPAYKRPKKEKRGKDK